MNTRKYVFKDPFHRDILLYCFCWQNKKAATIRNMTMNINTFLILLVIVGLFFFIRYVPPVGKKHNVSFMRFQAGLPSPLKESDGR